MIKYSFCVQKAKPTARQKAERMEQAMHDIEQVDCPIEHYFAPGLFAREMTIPKGVCVVGAVHKTTNISCLSAGTVRLITDAGYVDHTAPKKVLIKAGSKNQWLALDDAVLTNYFPNPDNETDIAKLVERYTESTLSELLGGSDNQQLTANKLAELEH